MIILDNKNIKIIRFIKFLNHKNLELYKIIKIYKNLIYELKLLILMRRLHFVFYL